MIRLPALLATFLGHCRDGRFWISTLISAMMWSLPVLWLDMWDSKRTEDGWRSFWAAFPINLLSTYLLLWGIAAVMHILYRVEVQSLAGWRFWVFPIFYMAAASLFFSSIMVVQALSGVIRHDDVGMALIITPLMYWLGGLVVVFYPLGWMTYPLAILNQLLIRKLYGTAGSK